MSNPPSRYIRSRRTPDRWTIRNIREVLVASSQEDRDIIIKNISGSHRRHLDRYSPAPTPHFDLPLKESILFDGKPTLPSDHPDEAAWVLRCFKQCLPLNHPELTANVLTQRRCIRQELLFQVLSKWDVHTGWLCGVKGHKASELALYHFCKILTSAGVCPVHGDHHCELRRNPAFNWQLMAELLELPPLFISHPELLDQIQEKWGFDTSKLAVDDLVRSAVYSHLRKLDWVPNGGTGTVG
mmetsp:Transcript_25705/g.47915  ORF Transcript_25705/g.47915 Transcript_25705/m.47915 type:complete len:241 (-) Transcript_25705:901-1623(-)